MSKVSNALDARYGEEVVKYNRNKINNWAYFTIGVREWWVKEKKFRNGSSQWRNVTYDDLVWSII